MKFHSGTCGLCKPTKRYKTNAARKSRALKRDITEEAAGQTTFSVRLREIKK